MLATCCFSLSLHRSISPVVRWGGEKMHAVNTDMGEGFDPSLHLSLFPATQLFLVPHSWPPTLCSSPLCPSHSNNPKLVFAWYTVKNCTASYSVHHQKGTAFQIINKREKETEQTEALETFKRIKGLRFTERAFNQSIKEPHTHQICSKQLM